jgi:lysozyme
MAKMRVPKWVIAAAMVTAIPFIADREGRVNTVYLDGGGVATVCIGHTGPEVRMGDTWSDTACDAAFAGDVQEAADIVVKHVETLIGPDEAAAYISFVLNVGETQFRKSTLLKMLNAGDHIGACDQLLRWVYDNGKRVDGLYNRRVLERQLCLGELHVRRIDTRSPTS